MTEFEAYKKREQSFQKRRHETSLVGIAQRAATKRAANTALLRAAKNRPCTDCNGVFPFYIMDLDHIHGKKEFELFTVSTRCTDKVIAEIAKCEAVCANCHRQRTYTRLKSKARGVRRDPSSRSEPLNPLPATQPAN